MASKQDTYRAELMPLIDQWLKSGRSESLEAYLIERGMPSSAMMNLAMARGFADLIAERAVSAKSKCLQLLDKWAILSENVVAPGDDQIILPATAVLSYG